MRPIHVAHLDKARLVADPHARARATDLATVTVAPITTTIRGLSTEVAVDEANGFDLD